MPDREKVIHAVETAFELWIDEYTGCSWFKEDEVRQAKEDALALLKERELWVNEIAEYQQSISGSGMHELDDYEKGKWDGLQIAWNIISEGR